MERTPIEAMIDQACGVIEPGHIRRNHPLVTLRCPECKHEKKVVRAKSDPPGTAVVQFICVNCLNAKNAEDNSDVIYFDSDGNQLMVF